MRVSNETYMSCTVCGAEATGLVDTNKIFGYKIVNEIIQPYSECRKCRDITSAVKYSRLMPVLLDIR